MLSIDNLHADVAGQKILNGLNLTLEAGQVHAIMGPNGAGKSTLSNVIAGHADVNVSAGSITFAGQDLLAMSVETRAHHGIFLGMQYPVELPGVNTMTFLKAAVNAKRHFAGEAALNSVQFLKLVKATAETMGFDPAFLKRSVNVGFSGGEKKRHEIFQMAMLQPRLALLDEIDSGLDIDALKTVADGVNQLRNPDRAILMITHYQRLLEYIKPDVVHVLVNGRIVKSGGFELAQTLEAKGYAWVTQEQAA